jgi:hypothetical protein
MRGIGVSAGHQVGDGCDRTREVAMREDPEQIRHGLGCGEIEAADPPARDRAGDEGGVRSAAHAPIGRVERRSGDLGPSLDPDMRATQDTLRGSVHVTVLGTFQGCVGLIHRNHLPHRRPSRRD